MLNASWSAACSHKLWLYYFYKQTNMNNFNPCYNLLYQFCMFPNYIPSHQNYYAPIGFYPHLVPPISNNLIIQNVVPSESISLPIQQAKSEEKVEVKSVKNELAEKQEASKLTVQSEQKTCKQSSKKEEGKKANRPLTYLTEKAYYMKQKLKQKQNNGIRILRKRLKNKQIRKIKKNEGEKEQKMERQKGEKGKKKMPIAKDSEKQQKILYRIKMKLAKQNLNEYAVIPKQISGITQLNQFCRMKYENLMQRQMNQN